MYELMSERERNSILLLVALFVIALAVTLVGVYDATVIFEDGSFVTPNGWTGCIPWEICWQ